MAQRIDWRTGDPAAPAPTSVVPGASVVVVDDVGRILMIRRADSGLWAIPGGAMHLGESLAEAAQREVREETGVRVELVGIVGTFSDPRTVVEFRGGLRDEVRQECSVCYLAEVIEGQAVADDVEATAVRWVDPTDLDGIPMTDAMRRRLSAWRSGRPHLG